MVVRRDGVSLTVLGLVVLGVALVWWRHFYASALGSRIAPPIECLYQTSGPCSVVGTVASLGGLTPYEPMLFWVGALMLGAGLILIFRPRGANR
jgi:hypothetical protein